MKVDVTYEFRPVGGVIEGDQKLRETERDIVDNVKGSYSC